MEDRFDGFWIEPSTEVPIEHLVARLVDRSRGVGSFGAQSSQRFDEVDDVELVTDDFVELPEALGHVRPEGREQLPLHVGLHAVVVKDGVIDVDQKDELFHWLPLAPLFALRRIRASFFQYYNQPGREGHYSEPSVANTNMTLVKLVRLWI